LKKSNGCAGSDAARPVAIISTTEYETLDKAGKGALLRRDGLYTSLIFGVA
jgi:hypothetical protein